MAYTKHRNYVEQEYLALEKTFAWLHTRLWQTVSYGAVLVAVSRFLADKS